MVSCNTVGTRLREELNCPLDLKDEKGSACWTMNGGFDVVVEDGSVFLTAGMFKNAGSTGGNWALLELC